MAFLSMFLSSTCVLLLLMNERLLVCGEDPKLPWCQPADYHWEYTECDNKGGRWKVQVPDPEKCTGGAPRPPERGISCDFTCKPGEFLDVQGNQTCQACPAGTFSLGGGVRFEDWDSLPVGFTVTTEKFGPSGYYGFSASESKDKNSTSNNDTCVNSAWTPNGKEISSIAGRCSASLSYTATLVKAGSITIEYQYEDEGAMFHLQISNSKCQSIEDRRSSPAQWPSSTRNNEWKKRTIDLKSGPNTISFKTLGLGVSSSRAGIRKPIRIKSIDITGIAFTQACTKCRNGTFSDKEKATECHECIENSYSGKGATQCTTCATDEYSDKGSASCTKKPACSDKDYFEYHTECDKNNQTMINYKWISPKKCKDGSEMQGAINLPASGKPEACPPCNPGMVLNNSKCQFCPASQYSDGISGCKSCPQNTAPDYGLSIQWWNNLPLRANLSSNCLALSEKGCLSKTGWVVSTDNIHTAKGQADDAFLVLSISVGGFKGQKQSIGSESIAVAKISFVFDLKCESKCTFFFMKQDEEDEDLDDVDVLETWVGSTNKQVYSFEIHDTEPVVFSWAFQKKELKDGTYHNTHLFANDIATIYSVNITNTAYGGAIKCTTCPQGVNKEGCIPCPPGDYIDPGTKRCMHCPPGTVVRGVNAWGRDSCMKCGQGLAPHVDGNTGKSECLSSCKFIASDGKSYDFTKLSQINYAEGTRLFTSSGTQYYHYFNISLCGGSFDFPRAMCYDNISDIATGSTGSIGQVKSMVCRSTIIPPKSGDMDVLISAQPASIGDILINITNKATDFLKEQIVREGFKNPDDDSENLSDVHFFYRSDSPTAACKAGRQTIISLRCDISAKGSGLIELPPKCSDGTCDGCTFHFLWKSVYACPVCEDKLYQEVRGECIDGEQQIHLIGPNYCPKKNKGPKQKCSILPFWLQVSIAAMCGVGVVLVILVIYCWKHNRKLEYRYMKLVGASEGRDGEMELPAAETCALSEEEDEQFDAVDFKESKGNKFFSKIKNMGRKGDNPFESIGLTDKEPLT